MTDEGCQRLCQRLECESLQYAALGDMQADGTPIARSIGKDGFTGHLRTPLQGFALGGIKAGDRTRTGDLQFTKLRRRRGK